MSKRKHADEIIKWASNKDSVVFCRSFKPTGETEWIPVSGDPSWLSKVEYKTILPEYAEAWQAWLDGELQVTGHNRGWWDLSSKGPPRFDNPPEDYRRKPKDPECSTYPNHPNDTVYEVSKTELADLRTELAELKAQHKLALEGWEREKNERMRLEEIAAEFDEQSKTNDHLSAMLKACKEEMERPTQRTEQAMALDLVNIGTILGSTADTWQVAFGKINNSLAYLANQIADLRKENDDQKKRIAEHKLTVQALDLECARQHASEEPNEEIEWPYRPEEYSFDEFLQKLISVRDDVRSGNNGSPSVIDGLRKLLAERNEELKERDSELVEANARAEHWKRLASEKAVNPTSTCMHDLVKILCVLRDRGTDMVVTVTGPECQGLTFKTYDVVGMAEDLVSLYESAITEVDRLAEEKETITEQNAKLEQELVSGKEQDLLRLLHVWFLKKAPEHYEGCGLYIDVIAALSSN